MSLPYLDTLYAQGVTAETITINQMWEAIKADLHLGVDFIKRAVPTNGALLTKLPMPSDEQTSGQLLRILFGSVLHDITQRQLNVNFMRWGDELVVSPGVICTPAVNVEATVQEATSRWPLAVKFFQNFAQSVAGNGVQLFSQHPLSPTGRQIIGMMSDQMARLAVTQSLGLNLVFLNCCDGKGSKPEEGKSNQIMPVVTIADQFRTQAGETASRHC